MAAADLAAAISSVGPIDNYAKACKAVDEVMKRVPGASSNDRYPCGFVYLFGHCSPKPGGKCHRCTDPSPKAALPPGTRNAIRAAVTDAAMAAKVLPN
jgi:hypothetical protein